MPEVGGGQSPALCPLTELPCLCWPCPEEGQGLPQLPRLPVEARGARLPPGPVGKPEYTVPERDPEWLDPRCPQWAGVSEQSRSRTIERTQA